MNDMEIGKLFEITSSGHRRGWVLSIGLACAALLTGCSDKEAPPPRPPAPPPGELEMVVPGSLGFGNLVPTKAVSKLEQEIVHNLYGGLFDPQVDRGYGPGLASELEFGLLSDEIPTSGDLSTSERPEATVRITAEHHWLTSGQAGTPGPKIDAYAVAEAWRKIVTDDEFPGRNRFTSVVESVEATGPETLRVVFRTRVEWTARAKEALGFRVFNPSDLSSQIPVGGGPFVLNIQPPSERQRDLLPSPNYARDADRPKIAVRTVPSARNRLRDVLEGKAQIALSIPPYYLRDVAGALTQKMDIYNVWALVFNPLRLNKSQRRYLVSTLDSQELLDSFLLGDSPNDRYLNDLRLTREKLLSPSIFPSTFEVFECIASQKAQGRLSPELIEVANWIANPQGFGGNFTTPPPSLPELKIAYNGEDDVFADGVANLVTKLKAQMDGNTYVPGYRVTAISSLGDWERIIAGLADGSSEYHAALVRFEYDRRCDVSVHFKNVETASLQGGGLFHWMSDNTGGRTLQWRTGDLATLRDAGYCDSAAEPALQVVRAVHDLAPAKFLFTMPSLIVYDGRVSVGVNDEFVLAGMKDWRFVPQDEP